MSEQEPRSELAKWQFASETTCIAQEDYADLEVIDISCFKPLGCRDPLDPHRRRIVERALNGFKETGFIVLMGHGLDDETISRQFDIGKMFLDDVSEDEKHRYHARIEEEGSWAGYKPRGYHKRANGSRDNTEFHDFYPHTVAEGQQPPASRPYLSEIKRFYNHNHFVVLRTVLEILSDGLGLPPDSLWNLHHRQNCTTDEMNRIHTKDLFRSGMYHPPTEEDREKSKQIWLPRHTDRGSLTLIYSQPIAGLQAVVDNRWKYIRHYPNGILVNLGDALEFTTGCLLKAAFHRVYEPPMDQRHLRRLGLFYFATMLPEVPLQPIEALASRAGPLRDVDVFYEFENLSGRVPTAEEWQVIRAKATGKPADNALFNKRFPTHYGAVPTW